jgi:hypothetical protein
MSTSTGRIALTRRLIEEIEAFQQVVASGKARYLGFSEWTAEQIQAAVDIAGPDLFVSSQPQYSMLWRAPEGELFPLCEANSISQIVWSPLAQGVLTGKYRPGQAPPSDSRAANIDMNVAMDRLMDDAVLEAVDRLRPIADQAGLSMAELALAWVLRRPELASAIVGARGPSGSTPTPGSGHGAHAGHAGGHRGGIGRHAGEGADARQPRPTWCRPTAEPAVHSSRSRARTMTSSDRTTTPKASGRIRRGQRHQLLLETQGAGRPMVLLHGGLGSGRAFGLVLPSWAERHQVFVVDLQGHGRRDMSTAARSSAHGR